MEEIRRSPVEVGGILSHYSQGFIHPRWLAGFLPSTVSLTVAKRYLEQHFTMQQLVCT